MDEIKGDFTRIPFKIFDRLVEREMNVRDIAVYFGITRNENNFPLSYRRLERITGIPRMTVAECVQRLIACKYLSLETTSKSETKVVKSVEKTVTYELLHFTNLVRFEHGDFRIYRNQWLHLPTDKLVIGEIYSMEATFSLSPIDLVVLMFLRRMKFINQKLPTATDYFSLNEHEHSKTLAVSRTTFRKSIDHLKALRFIYINTIDRTVKINYERINYFLRQKRKVIERNITRSVKNPDVFTDVDLSYFRYLIEEARSSNCIQALRCYAIDLATHGYLASQIHEDLSSELDRRVEFLDSNPSEKLPGQMLDLSELFPLKYTTNISVERHLGHYR